MSGKSASLGKGKGSITHNNRWYDKEDLPKHIDPDRIHLNKVYANESLAGAYQHCFSEAVERYNEKQTRADRKIDDYYTHLFNNQPKTYVADGGNKQHSFYEDVVQIGTMHDCGCGTPDGEAAAAALDHYMKGWQERNPNLYCFNAVLHLDEATPHLHIDYIPVATGYKKGLDTQNGLNKAIEQMGYKTIDKENTAFMQWRESERQALIESCKVYNIEIAEKGETRGHSLAPEEYKAQADELALQRSTIEKNKESIKTFNEKAKEINAIPEPSGASIGGKIQYTPEDNKKLRQLAKQGVALKNDISGERVKLKKRSDKLDELEKDLNKKIKANDKREDDLNKAIPIVNRQIEQFQAVNKMTPAEVIELKAENVSLKAKVKELTDKIAEITTDFKEKLLHAWEVARNTAQAMGMLKYDNNENGYKVPLTEKQSRLIDATANNVAYHADKQGYKEIAKQTRENIGISQGIQNQIDELMPKKQKTQSGPSL